MRNNHHQQQTPWRAAVVVSTILFIVSASATAQVNQGGLNATGSNLLRYADGFNTTTATKRPWQYLTNSTDIRLNIRTLYSRLRFDVEEPGMGFNPAEPVHREYLSRRTIGFDDGRFLIEAGHVSTQFGRGLTLSLKEDREVELTSILDGFFGEMRLPWMTIHIIAGRPYEWRNNPITLITQKGRRGDTLFTNVADFRMRDMIAGGSVELFLQPEQIPLPFGTSGSLSGNIVRYDINAGPLSSNYTGNHFLYQNMKRLYLPSLSGTASIEDFTFTAEQAWLRGTTHTYVTHDTMAYDSVFTGKNAPSTYLSFSGQIESFSLLAEYKNYFYAKSSLFARDNSALFTRDVASFLAPPSVRYIHSWHLLNKQLVSNLMDDIIGYNALLSWAPTESSLLTVNGSYGGRHHEASRFALAVDARFWELYAEWSQMVGKVVQLKTGFDYGKLDPFQPKVTFRTFAAEAMIGPLHKRHSMGITFESQINSKPFLAERSRSALIDLIKTFVAPDSLLPYYNPVTGESSTRDTLRYDNLVPGSNRSTYTQFAVNLLTTLSYSYSPWLTGALTFEHEVKLEEFDNIHIVTDLSSHKKYYASAAIGIKPHPNHTLTIEYGSMSGGKKCSLGTCVDLPPFEGLKVKLVSIL